jgi:hypothetical protein
MAVLISVNEDEQVETPGRNGQASATIGTKDAMETFRKIKDLTIPAPGPSRVAWSQVKSVSAFNRDLPDGEVLVRARHGQ